MNRSPGPSGARRQGMFHAGPRLQRGQGLFSFIGKIARKLLPIAVKTGKKFMKSDIVKSTIDTAKSSALEAGIGLTKDLLNGKNLQESISTNLNMAKDQITDALKSSVKAAVKRKMDNVKGNPANNKKKKKKKERPQIGGGGGGAGSKKKKNGKKRDIFDV